MRIHWADVELEEQWFLEDRERYRAGAGGAAR